MKIASIVIFLLVLVNLFTSYGVKAFRPGLREQEKRFLNLAASPLARCKQSSIRDHQSDCSHLNNAKIGVNDNSATLYEENPWFRFDLNAQNFVQRVRVWLFISDTSAPHPSSLQLHITNKSIDDITIGEFSPAFSGKAQNMEGSSMLLVVFNIDRVARSFELGLTSSGRLVVSELEILGNDSDATAPSSSLERQMVALDDFNVPLSSFALPSSFRPTKNENTVLVNEEERSKSCSRWGSAFQDVDGSMKCDCIFGSFAGLHCEYSSLIAMSISCLIGLLIVANLISICRFELARKEMLNPLPVWKSSSTSTDNTGTATVQEHVTRNSLANSTFSYIRNTSGAVMRSLSFLPFSASFEKNVHSDINMSTPLQGEPLTITNKSIDVECGLEKFDNGLRPSSHPPHFINKSSTVPEALVATPLDLLTLRPRKKHGLALFFASPLVYYDRKSNKRVPLENINIDGEYALLRQSLLEAGLPEDFLLSNGHCHPEYVAFEDRTGGAHFLSHRDFCNFFRAGINNMTLSQEKTKTDFGSAKDSESLVRLLFLNCCHSYHLGKQLCEIGLPNVLCIRGKVRDDSASVFTRAFYLALSSGRSTRKSFNIAQQAVRVNPTVPARDANNFVLLPDISSDSQDHSDVLWDFHSVSQRRGLRSLKGMLPHQLHEAMLLSPSHPKKYQGRTVRGNHLPLQGKGFIGRNNEIHEAVMNLRRRRIVVLCTAKQFHKDVDRGVGKSQLAIAVARHVDSRAITKDGVIFVGMKGIDSFEKFVGDLLRQMITSGLNVENQSLEYIYRALQELDLLLVIDGVDQLVQHHPAMFDHFLQSIVSRTNCRILLTRHAPLETCGAFGANYSQHICNQFVGGLLSDTDAAKLFIRRSKKSISMSFAPKVSQLDIFAALRNHPQHIERVASQIEDITTLL
eukprot:g1118.t1